MNRWPRRGERKAAALLDRDGAVVLQRCPVTGGNPTVMSAESFDRLCAAARKRAENDPGVMTGFCVQCAGKNKPVELTIVDLCQGKNREVVMAHNRFDGACDSCGQERKQLQRQYEDNVCPSCMVVRIACKNRPEVVIEQLRKLAPGVLAVAMPVTVNDDNSLLTKLREIIGAGDGDIVQAAERNAAGWREAEMIRRALDIDHSVALAEYVDSMLDSFEKKWRSKDLLARRLENERDELAEEVRGLRERLQTVAANDPLPVVEELVGVCSCSREGVLLDLLIDALGDQVINLGASQIRALREVA